MHREGQMQFQSPVALRLLPTLPAHQQLKRPTPAGSQTDRGGGAATAFKPAGSSGSKTHRSMASTNATSLAAVKQASERNHSLFLKISESVGNISAVLRADAVRDAGAAEAAEAAQDLRDVVDGIIRPSPPPAVNASHKSSIATRSFAAKDPALPRGQRGSLSKQSRASNVAPTVSAHTMAAHDSYSSPLISQIERLMAACGGLSSEEAILPSHEVVSPRRRGQKAVKMAGESAGGRSSNPGVVRVRHVPLGFTDKKLRSLFCKYGSVVHVKLESKYGAVKVAEVTFEDMGSARAAVNAMNGYVGKDVSEPLLCALQGEESTAEAEQSTQIIVKDNILSFSRQNLKLCAAEADFERLLKNKDETSELFKSLCEGSSGVTLRKIEVWIGLHYSVLLGDGLRHAFAVVTGAPVSRRVPLKEEQFSLFLVKVLYYTQALLLFNAIDTDANRRLDFEEFKTAMPLLNLPASVNIERLFHDLDDNGSGVVRYEEFCEWLESTKRSNFEIVARHSSQSGSNPDPKLRSSSICSNSASGSSIFDTDSPFSGQTSSIGET